VRSNLVREGEEIELDRRSGNASFSGIPVRVEPVSSDRAPTGQAAIAQGA